MVERPSRVILGGNIFDGQTLGVLGSATGALLAFELEGDAPVVTLALPKPDGGVEPLVERNALVSERDLPLDIVPGSGAVRVKHGEEVLLEAHLDRDARVVRVLRFDLRSLGVAVFTDGTTLRIGPSVFHKNHIRGGTFGISLGRPPTTPDALPAR